MSTRRDRPMIDDPRMRGFRSRASVEEAQAVIDARPVVSESESVPLIQAAGRVLAEGITAEVSVPHFARAAMDGFAMRGEETFGADAYTPAPFRLIGRSRPGHPFGGMVGPGEAVEIATGAPVPIGADAVAKYESSRRDDSSVSIFEPTSPGRNVGRVGEDVTIGSLLFEPGRRLRPQDLGVLSAVGRSNVAVVARPRVTILVTGDELLPAGSPPIGPNIPDMNSVMLSALVLRDGGIPRVIGPLPDGRDQIRSAMIEAAAWSHVVILSGGTSTGPEDHAPSILAELGELAIHGVGLRPAAPTGIGFIGRVPVFLLPGNPVSCLCGYDFFAGRSVRRRAGRSPQWSYRPLDLPLGEKLSSALGRVDYARVTIRDGLVFPLATSGASILSSTTRADGFVVVAASREGYPRGDRVTAWLYEG